MLWRSLVPISGLVLFVACSEAETSPPAAGPTDAGTSGPSLDGAAYDGGGSSGSDGSTPGADAAVEDAGVDGTAPPSGFPDATNTGYKHAPGYPGKLTPWDGKPLENDRTYSFIDFPGGVDVGSSSNAAHGIKLVGCRFHGTAPGEKLVGVFGTDITFDYDTFEPDAPFSTALPYASSYQYGIAGNGGYYTHAGKLTVSHSELWGFGNAIDVTPTNSADTPQVYRDNWIHDAADPTHDVYHHDGIGAESGSASGGWVTIDHNTIESAGNTNAIAYQATGPYQHFTITNNLFGGFGYTVAILGTVTNVVFTGNTFSTRLPCAYGPIYPNTFWTTATTTWSGNRWKVPAGAAWGKPAHDGWFWLPLTPGGTSDDTGYVSQTDHQ